MQPAEAEEHTYDYIDRNDLNLPLNQVENVTFINPVGYDVPRRSAHQYQNTARIQY